MALESATQNRQSNRAFLPDCRQPGSYQLPRMKPRPVPKRSATPCACKDEHRQSPGPEVPALPAGYDAPLKARSIPPVAIAIR